MSKLRYSFEPDKFSQVSGDLVQRCSQMTKMKLFKLMFLADKEHMSQYGRPICGGHDVAMEFGPVHAEGYNVLKAWSRSRRNEEISFEHFLADADPAMRELVFSDQEVRDLVEDVGLFEEPVGA